MKKLISLFLVLVFGMSLATPITHAAEYSKATIVENISEQRIELDNGTQIIQELKVKDLETDTEHIVEFQTSSQSPDSLFEKGDTVVLEAFGDTRLIQDNYRLNGLLLLAIIFFSIVLIFAKSVGIRSILGLGISLVIIIYYIIPFILKGYSPLLISITGSLLIAMTSLYTAHGFKPRIHVALLSTVITFTITAIMAVSFVKIASLFGLGTEEAMFIVGDARIKINMQGILLGGIIIGTLGVLDDITTSQAAAIDEINKANPKLTMYQLYKHGTSIGKEHIASLINTLALAYVGAALPLLLLFSINQGTPLWVIVNSEYIAEEIVRTMIGSLSLVLAVPITTILATYFLKKTNVKLDGPPGCCHHK